MYLPLDIRISSNRSHVDLPLSFIFVCSAAYYLYLLYSTNTSDSIYSAFNLLSSPPRIPLIFCVPHIIKRCHHLLSCQSKNVYLLLFPYSPHPISYHAPFTSVFEITFILTISTTTSLAEATITSHSFSLTIF